MVYFYWSSYKRINAEGDLGLVSFIWGSYCPGPRRLLDFLNSRAEPLLIFATELLWLNDMPLRDNPLYFSELAAFLLKSGSQLFGPCIRKSNDWLIIGAPTSFYFKGVLFFPTA